MNRDEQIEAGAQALANAFPTLTEDFPNPWFRKAARIVLEAAQDEENR